MLAELGMFWRYARALRHYLGDTTNLAKAKAELRQAYEQRDAIWLDTVRRGVFERAQSPYLPLLRWAGVEYGDVEKLVRAEGLDAALGKLYAAGVSISLDEFKGLRPVRRAGLEYAVRAEDFDSPLLSAHFEGRTGGSGGVRRRLLVDMGLIARDAAAHVVSLDSLGYLRYPSATWRAVPPNNSGIKKLLFGVRIGAPLERWFSELPVDWSPGQFKYAAFTAYTVAAARMSGRPFPYPEHVPRERTIEIVRWMAAKVAAGTPVYMDCAASAAVRICSTAMEAGENIAGSVFRAGSEPLTEARAKIIVAAGARVLSGYASSETGPMAFACGEAAFFDDVHVMLDKMAVIQRGSGALSNAGALLLTTIFPACPKILLNVDSGDSGVLEERRCGCAWGEMGFHLHLRQIRSIGKLTSEGILLSASEVLRLVEEVLPARFGGAPTDYQLVEDGRDALPVVAIVVSPRRGEMGEQEIVQAVLDGIRSAGAGGRLMADQLEQAGTLRVWRREPFQTAIGKLLPLFVIPKE